MAASITSMAVSRSMLKVPKCARRLEFEAYCYHHRKSQLRILDMYSYVVDRGTKAGIFFSKAPTTELGNP